MNKEFIDADENFYSVLLNKAVATKKALEIKIKLFSNCNRTIFGETIFLNRYN